MKPSRGYLLALASTLLLSTTGILIKYLLVHFQIQPVTLAFWRSAIVSVTMLTTLAFVRPAWLRIRWRDIPFYLVYGLVGVAFSQILWTYSVSLNGAALATVLVYSSPAIVAFLSRWLFREPLTWTKGVALFLTLLGCVLASRVYDTSQLRLGPLGVLCGLASGFTYSGYTLFGKEAGRRHHPITAMAYAFACGALFLGLAQSPTTILGLGNSLKGWGVLVLLALGPTLGGFGLFTLSLRDLPASVAGLIAPLELIFTSVIAFVTLGETLLPPQIVGAALIATSAILLRPRRERVAKQEGVTS